MLAVQNRVGVGREGLKKGPLPSFLHPSRLAFSMCARSFKFYMFHKKWHSSTLLQPNPWKFYLWLYFLSKVEFMLWNSSLWRNKESQSRWTLISGTLFQFSYRVHTWCSLAALSVAILQAVKGNNLWVPAKWRGEGDRKGWQHKGTAQQHFLHHVGKKGASSQAAASSSIIFPSLDKHGLWLGHPILLAMKLFFKLLRGENTAQTVPIAVQDFSNIYMLLNRWMHSLFHIQ